jgi:methylenetetrahydrofolate dehydrogenase (NADP+)/methenyltetrahydrofolate cyclohydrolase
MTRVDLDPLLNDLRAQLRERTTGRRRPVRLGVLVERGNVAGGSFARSLEKEAALAGIAVVHRVAEPDDPDQTLILLDELVVDPTISGVVVVQPVRSLPTAVVAAHLPASKDVEAITPAALAAAAAGGRRGTPVAEACLAILLHLGVDLERVRVLLVGHGPTGGRPIAQRLLAAGAQLTVVQREVAALDPLPAYDVLISAVGSAGVIPESVVHAGATVLDVGTSMVAGQLRGDLSPGAALRAGRHTPVPGGVGRITSVCALLSLTELAAIPPGPVASWSLLEAVARLLSPRDPAGGAAAAAITGALAAALDGLCRMHGDSSEIARSGQTAVRLLLAADRDREAFGEYQRARRADANDLEDRRLTALATPAEIAAQLEALELRLGQLTTTPALELDRRLAQEIAGAAREAVRRLQEEFSQQS